MIKLKHILLEKEMIADPICDKEMDAACKLTKKVTTNHTLKGAEWDKIMGNYITYLVGHDDNKDYTYCVCLDPAKPDLETTITSKEIKLLKKQIEQKGNVGFWSSDKHMGLDIIALAVAFIPYVGPFLSAGIEVGHSALYYKEGDRATAGLSLIFAAIPFLGRIPGIRNISGVARRKLIQKLNTGKVLSISEEKYIKHILKNKKSLIKGIGKIDDLKASVIRHSGIGKWDNIVKSVRGGKISPKTIGIAADDVATHSKKYFQHGGHKYANNISNAFNDSPGFVTTSTKSSHVTDMSMTYKTEKGTIEAVAEIKKNPKSFYLTNVRQKNYSDIIYTGNGNVNVIVKSDITYKDAAEKVANSLKDNKTIKNKLANIEKHLEPLLGPPSDTNPWNLKKLGKWPSQKQIAAAEKAGKNIFENMSEKELKDAGVYAILRNEPTEFPIPPNLLEDYPMLTYFKDKGRFYLSGPQNTIISPDDATDMVFKKLGANKKNTSYIIIGNNKADDVSGQVYRLNASSDPFNTSAPIYNPPKVGVSIRFKSQGGGGSNRYYGLNFGIIPLEKSTPGRSFNNANGLTEIFTKNI